MNSIYDAVEQLGKLTRSVENVTAPFEELRVRYLVPTLHVDVVSDSFGRLSAEDRLESVQLELEKDLFVESVNLAQVAGRLPVSFNFLTKLEATEKIKVDKWSDPKLMGLIFFR